MPDEQPIYMLRWKGRRDEFRTFGQIVDNMGGLTVTIVSNRRQPRRFGLEFHADATALARIRAVFAHTPVLVLT
jgi:hypothetical protein